MCYYAWHDCCFLCVYRSVAAFHQFQEGASKLWGAAQRHPQQLKSLFVDCGDPLTFTTFRQLYNIIWPDVGSNHRDCEEDTIFAWEVCLQKCGCTKVLAYIFICAQCIDSNKPSAVQLCLAVQNSRMPCSILFIVGHHDLSTNLVVSSVGQLKPKTQQMT